MEFYLNGAKSYIFGTIPYKNYEKKINSFIVNNLIPKRDSVKMETKRIFSEGSREDITFSKTKAQTRYLPYSSPVNFRVISNLVTIGIITEEPLVISIESEEVAKSYIEHFEFLWKQAKP
jgi:hypothetical protein